MAFSNLLLTRFILSTFSSSVSSNSETSSSIYLDFFFLPDLDAADFFSRFQWTSTCDLIHSKDTDSYSLSLVSMSA